MEKLHIKRFSQSLGKSIYFLGLASEILEKVILVFISVNLENHMDKCPFRLKML